ncbi:MAG: hypothetical protein P4L35_04425 [Ignavibacteriaceae bacterium]|nr:hypothetical protein [Ignavibacteriaceae bacterium]
MNNSTADYSAENILMKIRNQNLLEKELVLQLNGRPYIDDLREMISVDDIKYLQIYIESPDNVYKQFALALLQNISSEPLVKDLFFKLWKEAKTYDEKMNVMFRILDYEDLNQEIHENIYQFALQYWDQWINDCIKWQSKNNPDLVIANMTERLNDPRFPYSKKWIYLLIATASRDFDRVLELLDKYAGTNKTLVEKIKAQYNCKKIGISKMTNKITVLRFKDLEWKQSRKIDGWYHARLRGAQDEPRSFYIKAEKKTDYYSWICENISEFHVLNGDLTVNTDVLKEGDYARIEPFTEVFNSTSGGMLALCTLHGRTAYARDIFERLLVNSISEEEYRILSKKPWIEYLRNRRDKESTYLTEKFRQLIQDQNISESKKHFIELLINN